MALDALYGAFPGRFEAIGLKSLGPFAWGAGAWASVRNARVHKECDRPGLSRSKNTDRQT